jgi:putative NADH-flavin reductase
MKIAVIAANGRTGQAFVAQALQAGHLINANVHNSNNLKPHPNLSILKGDASDRAYINKLLKDQEAVVSFIGHTKNSGQNIQTKTTEVLVEVMAKNNIKRLVSLTGTGVRFPNDKITLIDRFLNSTIRLIDPKRINDGLQHVEVIKNSDSDWTVLRVLKLQNTSLGEFKLTLNGPAKLIVARAEVAQAVLDMLEHKRFMHQAPIISPKN